MDKPKGWRYESARHALAAKGIKTKNVSKVQFKVAKKIVCPLGHPQDKRSFKVIDTEMPLVMYGYRVKTCQTCGIAFDPIQMDVDYAEEAGADLSIEKEEIWGFLSRGERKKALENVPENVSPIRDIRRFSKMDWKDLPGYIRQSISEGQMSRAVNLDRLR